MLKQSLLILAAAGLISIAAPFATAQNNPSQSQFNNQQFNDQQSQTAQDNGRRHHGPPDPAERTRELTKHLKLNSDQQTKVQDALVSARSQTVSLHQDTSLSEQDRRSKMTEIRKSTDEQIRGLLDTNQQKKWDAMQAKREQRMQNGRVGEQSAPPQQ
jgi:periplasmic protein CpxP/Spy